MAHTNPIINFKLADGRLDLQESHKLRQFGAIPE